MHVWSSDGCGRPYVMMLSSKSNFKTFLDLDHFGNLSSRSLSQGLSTQNVWKFIHNFFSNPDNNKYVSTRKPLWWILFYSEIVSKCSYLALHMYTYIHFTKHHIPLVASDVHAWRSSLWQPDFHHLERSKFFTGQLIQTRNTHCLSVLTENIVWFF